MGQLLIFSAVLAVASTLLIVPFTGEGKAKAAVKKYYGTFIGSIFLVSFLIVFVGLYISKIDLQWSLLIYPLPVVAIFGAIFATGKEQAVKSAIVLAGIIGVAYLISAPLWNADEKYKSAEMKKAEEITAFDEKETPASVPPKFAKNKMKKAFGQVPNTSFYELGNLQIQKVNGEYVYIAQVEV